MKIKGKLEIETDGQGAYEATVDGEFDDIWAVVAELGARIAAELAE